MSKLAPQNDILQLSPKTQNGKGHFKNTQEENLEESESFLNTLLASIEETNEFLPQNMKISKEEVAFEVMDKLKLSSFNEQDKISIFESASFMQILSMLDKLKMDTKEVKFSNLSTQLSQLIKSEANFSALKGAKNIGELLQVAKDLGLEVRDIKVDRLLDLKASFPNLDKADFFKGAMDNVFKKVIENKIAHIEKELDKNLQGQNLNTNTPKPKKNETLSLLSQTLQNLEALATKKTDKKEVKEEKIKEPVLSVKENLKEVKEEKIKEPVLSVKENLKEVKEEKIKEPVLSVKENLKEVKEEKIKEPVLSVKENLKEVKEEKIKEPVLSVKENLKEVKEEKIKEPVLSVKENLKEVKEEKIKEPVLSVKENLKEVKEEKIKEPVLSVKENLKEVKEEKIKEPVLSVKENLKEVKEGKNPLNIMAQKITQENSKMQEVAPALKNTQSVFTQSIETAETSQNSQQNQENPHKESGAEDLNSLVKDLHKIHQNQSKNISAKETLQYFSQDLKEAVEQYKAPISKLSITLNPSNLGEVEVTLIQRGSNLHINFNSNTNAMQIFLQNQAEFKNSLVNMGFTGLEMNFSDQKREQNQQERKRNDSRGFREVLENKDEEKMSLELVLAKYF